MLPLKIDGTKKQYLRQDVLIRHSGWVGAGDGS